jgi:hypothetical protein
MTAASPCPLSMARWRGVLPARSAVLRRVLGRPSGGRRRMFRKAPLPVVAARWSGCWFARSRALICTSAPLVAPAVRVYAHQLHA